MNRLNLNPLPTANVEEVYQDAELVEVSLAALKSYEQTGLHITLDEAECWMRTWGTPQETTMPKATTKHAMAET